MHGAGGDINTTLNPQWVCVPSDLICASVQQMTTKVENSSNGVPYSDILSS